MTHRANQGEVWVFQRVQAGQRRGFLWKHPRIARYQEGYFVLARCHPQFEQRPATQAEEAHTFDLNKVKKLKKSQWLTKQFKKKSN